MTERKFGYNNNKTGPRCCDQPGRWSNRGDGLTRLIYRNQAAAVNNEGGFFMTEENDFVEISWSVTGTTDSIRINAAEVDNFLLKARVLSDTARIANVGLAPIKNGGQIDAPKLTESGSKKPNFGTRPEVRKRRMEIYNRQESIRNGRITVQNLAEEYVQARRTIEEDLRKLGIARK